MMLHRPIVFALVIGLALVSTGCPETTPAPPDAADVATDATPDVPDVPESDGGGTEVTDTLDASPPDAGEETVDDVMPDSPQDTVPDGTGDTMTDSADGDTGPDVPTEPANACLEAGTGPDFQVSARGNLRWKRAMALERDVLGALELTKNEACGEVGFDGICFNLLHLVPLGGNEPVVATMYEPLPAPAVTTAVAVDRVMVAACGAAVDRDTVLTSKDNPDGEAKAIVFGDLDLHLDAVSPLTKGVDAVVTNIYRRFLARDPSPQELSLVLTLTEPVDGQAPTARDFAKMACFAVATTTENIFQ